MQFITNFFQASALPKLAVDIDRTELKIVKFILLFLLAWGILAAGLSLLYPDPEGSNLQTAERYLKHAWKNGKIFIFIFLVFLSLKLLVEMRGRSLVGVIKERLSNNGSYILTFPFRVTAGLLTFAIFMFAFATIKVRIPVIVPFYLDEFFYQLDRLLFLGNDPWELFRFVFNYPIVIWWIDFIYDIWAVVLIAMWMAQFLMTEKPAQARYRFGVALMLTWLIGGNILAIVLSSAGPCYFEPITGLNSYAPQLALMQDIEGLKAVTYQSMLWDVYVAPGYGVGGISAMPSMHCATSFLLILAFGKNRPILKGVLIVFFTTILISSFILAWHYAVDGLLAALVALLCWKLAGFLLRKTAR